MLSGFLMKAQPILFSEDITPSNSYTFINSSVEMQIPVIAGNNGENIHWDFSSLPMEFSGVTGKLILTKDSPFPELPISYLIETRYASDPTLVYEFYTKHGSALHLTGFGLVSEDGGKSTELYDNPFTLFRFPWELNAGFEDDNSLRVSIRRYVGYGSLTLPIGYNAHARKFVEEYYDGTTKIEEYTWFVDSLPHPSLIITNEFIDDVQQPNRQIIQINKPVQTSTHIEESHQKDPFVTFHDNSLHVQNQNMKINRYEVYSSLGTIVEKGEHILNGDSFHIDLSESTTGMYVLVLHDENSSVISIPFLIQR